MFILSAALYGGIITEERLARMGRNLGELVIVQDQMLDLLGMTMEGERRLATRMERQEALNEETDRRLKALAETTQEIGDKLNALIAW